MYDSILSRSFSRNDQKRFGNCALLICLIVALSLCTVFRPQFHTSVLNLGLSTGAGVDMLIVRDASMISERPHALGLPTNSGKQEIKPPESLPLATSELRVEDIKPTTTEIKPTVSQPLATSELHREEIKPETSEIDPTISRPLATSELRREEIKPTISEIDPMVSRPLATSEYLKEDIKPTTLDIKPTISQHLTTSELPQPSQTPWKGPHAIVLHTDEVAKIAEPVLTTLADHPSQMLQRHKETGRMDLMPVCSTSEPLSDYCEMEGNIRIVGNASTIFVISSSGSSLAGNTSWKIKPYARKGNVDAMNCVKEWTVKVVDEAHDNVPSCTKNHTSPAILFSAGGYSGNFFHGFSDVLIPLVSNSYIFRGNVHFLATDYKSWWISKFQKLFDKLSDHQVVDIDREEGTQCFQRVIVGLKSHKELGINTSKSPNGFSMKDFREFLRTTYSLQRETSIKIRKSDATKPRLLLLSRKKSRKLLNEGKILKVAQRLGYEVVVANVSISTNVSSFAQVVNSCDVFMGVHGAGLTNMIFLPDNAVVIQVVPLGGIDGFAHLDFGEPSKDMNLRYLSYKIRVEESSLIKQYPLDHQVIRDPFSFHKQGWFAIRTNYLDNQDVMLDVRRFRSTLAKALKLLQH